jgi:hypothetical protein
VGDLLLRRERDETAAISHLAQELLDKEYRTPSRELRCSAERDACLQCYLQNAASPLNCAAQVDAFARCADATLKARNGHFSQRTTGADAVCCLLPFIGKQEAQAQG